MRYSARAAIARGDAMTPQDDTAPGPPRVEAAWTAAVGVIAMAAYIATLCPTVYVMDSPELVAAAHVFGVPHPPGYPVFTMLYGAAMRLVPLGEVALRANVVTALLSAGAVALLFRAARTFGASRPAAGLAALGVALARDWWVQAVSTEVYALDALLVAAVLLFVARLARDPARAAAWTALGLTCGLAVGHRATNLLFFAPLVLWADHLRRGVGAPSSRRVRFLVAGFATVLVFLYVPIAASLEPPISHGDPTTLARFWSVVSAESYARHLEGTTAMRSLARLADVLLRVPPQAPVVVLFAAFALWCRRKADGHSRGLAWALAAVAALDVAFTCVYDVSDNQGFLQPAFCAAGILAAWGLDDALRNARARSAVLATCGLLTVIPAAVHWNEIDLSGERSADRYGTDLLDSVAPNSLVLSFDDTAYATMIYEQAVNGARPDVAVISAPAEWQLREAQRRAPLFDAGGADGADGEGWLMPLARRLVTDPERGLYVTDAGEIDFAAMVGPDIAPRLVTVPEGLLFRVVLPPPGAGPSAPVPERIVRAANDYWRTHSIPRLVSARQDPPLLYLPARYARPRLLLALVHVLEGRVQAAVPHLEAVASADVDANEALVLADLRSAGIDSGAWKASERAAAGLAAIRSGAPREVVLRALAPR